MWTPSALHCIGAPPAAGSRIVTIFGQRTRSPNGHGSAPRASMTRAVPTPGISTGSPRRSSALAVTARILGKRETACYLAALVVCALLSGLAADAIYTSLDIGGIWAGGEIEGGAGVSEYLAALVFLALAGWGYWKSRTGGGCR